MRPRQGNTPQSRITGDGQRCRMFYAGIPGFAFVDGSDFEALRLTLIRLARSPIAPGL